MAGSAHPPPITEVLREPGAARLWVTVGGSTHLLDLAALQATAQGQPLRLPRVWQAVTVTPDGAALAWPGVTLAWERLQLSSVHHLPFTERYRPLLPYLRCHEPPLSPIALVTPDRLQSLLSLKAHQVEQATRCLGVSPPLAQQRLYDVGCLLAEYVGSSALLPLLRRPWPVARRLNDPRLQSMQDCLIEGRPDVVERTALQLLLGES